MPLNDISGQRFGRLVVVGRGPSIKGSALWECRCDCGGSALRTSSRLRRTATAGCKKCDGERKSIRQTVHGGAAKGKTKLYNVWKEMRQRCADASDQYYGGKGIRVCEAWHEFTAFRNWADDHGYAPGLTIERIDSAAGYSPENYEWVTQSINSQRARAHQKARKGLYDEACYGDF